MRELYNIILFLLVVSSFLAISYGVQLSCTTDTDCPTSAWCENVSTFTCQEKLADGMPCSENRQCLSGWCGDGVCTTNVLIPTDKFYECDSSSGICNVEEVTIGDVTGPKGCYNSSQCSSGYFCMKQYHQCVKCPTPNSPLINGINISNDQICYDTACVGYDLDCCANDDQCPAGRFCNSYGACIDCTTNKDEICPSKNCMGIDPDCCTIDDQCDEGEKCIGGTCTLAIGKSCVSDVECGSGICYNGECVLRDFLSADTTQKSTKAGKIARFNIFLRNPFNEPRRICVEVLEGDGYPYSAFEGGEKRICLNLKALETAQLGLEVYGALPGSIIVTNVEANAEGYTKRIVLKTEVSGSPQDNLGYAPTASWVIEVLLTFSVATLVMLKNVNTYK